MDKSISLRECHLILEDIGYVIKSGTREEIEKYIKDEHFEVLYYTLSQKTGLTKQENV